MSDRTEIESAFGYKQFAQAYDLLDDLIAKIQGALQSSQIIDWRAPALHIELARAYEALSRDVWHRAISHVPDCGKLRSARECVGLDSS